MLAVENPQVNGAELLKRLAETGTGAAKLELPRQLLAFTHRKYGKIATANEVLDALEKGGAPELTLAKAKEIAATGKYDPAAKAPETPVEELLLAGAALPPEPVKPALEEMAEEGPLEKLAAATEENPVEMKKVAKAKRPAE